MDAISKWAQLVGRVALGTVFVVSGLGKLAAWRGTVAYASSKAKWFANTCEAKNWLLLSGDRES